MDQPGKEQIAGIPCDETAPLGLKAADGILHALLNWLKNFFTQPWEELQHYAPNWANP